VTIGEAESKANVLMGAFGATAVQVSDFTKAMTDRLVYMASCQPFTAAYMNVRDPLCSGARPAIDTIFLSSFIAAVLLLPLVCVGVSGLKHARQRMRDAEHPWLNTLVMFDYATFRQVRYLREKELDKIRDIEEFGIRPEGELGRETDGVQHKYPVYGEELVFVNPGTGVDGWGHDSCFGEIPAKEKEPILFPGKPIDYDFLADNMFKGISEQTGLNNSTVVSRLDTSGYVCGGGGGRCIYVCVYVYMCIYICVDVYTSINLHTHTHTHTHTQTFSLSLSLSFSLSLSLSLSLTHTHTHTQTGCTTVEKHGSWALTHARVSFESPLYSVFTH
jgi:hypothetical protein